MDNYSGEGRVVFTPAVPRAWMVARLSSLRTEFEAEIGAISDSHGPAALILADVCDVLELNDVERRIVLGPETAALIEEVRDGLVRLLSEALQEQ
jgi:hypothetical protein